MLIKLTEQSAYSSNPILLNINEISSIQDSGMSSKWHGTMSYVTMNNKKTYSISETVEQIEARILENE